MRAIDLEITPGTVGTLMMEIVNASEPGFMSVRFTDTQLIFLVTISILIYHFPCSDVIGKALLYGLRELRCTVSMPEGFVWSQTIGDNSVQKPLLISFILNRVNNN